MGSHQELSKSISDPSRVEEADREGNGKIGSWDPVLEQRLPDPGGVFGGQGQAVQVA